MPTAQQDYAQTAPASEAATRSYPEPLRSKEQTRNECPKESIVSVEAVTTPRCPEKVLSETLATELFQLAAMIMIMHHRYLISYLDERPQWRNQLMTQRCYVTCENE